MTTRIENFSAGLMAVFLLLPVVLVHTGGENSWIRATGTVIALLSVVIFAGYFAVRKGSIYRNSPIEKKFGNRGVKIWDITTRIICIIFFAGGSVWLINIGAGIKAYLATNSFVTIEATMNKLQIVALPGSTLLHVTVLTDNGEYPSLSYWYPRNTLRSGQKYSFKLLPDTNFVMSVETVE